MSRSIGAALTADELKRVPTYVKYGKNFYSPLPATARGKPTLLGEDPHKKDKILYCVGSDVIIRSLSNPLEGDIYIEHPRQTTTARLSPNGQYVASTDITGMVRVWHTQDVQGYTHKIALERPSIAGAPTDLAWGPESKRILVVGPGAGSMGAVFFVDGGNSCGTVSGSSKKLTSCDLRPCRPYTAVTVSEDLSTAFLAGPPYKWKHSQTNNTRYPNCVRFNPSGSHFCVVGQDKKIWLADGKTGEKTTEFELAHKGGVYQCSWNDQGDRILTASGDKTCKIWDVSTGKPVTSFSFGTTVNDQQLGCVWQGDFLVSLSLGGQLKYMDPNSGKIVKVLEGHQKDIKSVTYHKATNSIYTGSYTSRLVRWDVDTGDNERVDSKHGNSIISLENAGTDIYSTGLDDTFRITGGIAEKSSVSLGARPFNMGSSRKTEGVAVVGAYDEKVRLIKGGAVVDTKDVSYRPISCAVSPDGSQAAVGGNDNKVHIFDISGNKLNPNKDLTGHTSQVSALSYSDDGKFLASGGKKIIVWNSSDLSIKSKDKFIYHTAKINGMEWSPNSRYLASVGLDTKLIVWDIQEEKKNMQVQAAHHGSANDCTWIDDSTVATVGADASLRTFTISFD